jgi:HSP20 family protein
MFSSMPMLDTLFDELWRSNRDSSELGGAGSPWISGIRSVSRGTFPPINIGSSPDSVHVYAFAAGLDPQSIDLTLQQNILTLSGERKPHEVEQNAVFYRHELFQGAFRRVITLPEDVNPDDVEARYQSGVLHVRIGRREEVKPRQIQIQ